jgi:cell wall-associated NlpC family hydrolase
VFCVFGFKASAANEGAGIVRVDTDLCLRTEPSESSRVLTYAKKDDNVVIVKWAGNWDWYEVIYNGKRGFMNAKYVAAIDSANYDVGMGEIVGENVNVRDKPDVGATILKQLDLGATVDVIGVNTQWYKVQLNDDVVGYISSDYLRIIFTDDAANTSAGDSNASSAADVTASATVNGVTSAKNVKSSSYTDSTGTLTFDTSTTVGKMAELGMSLLGIDYVYGGTTPKGGFDCSGFIYYISKEYGYDLPHNSGRQSKLGTKVDKTDLQLGDLVFFGPGGSVNHVGMYLGDGVFIHSSSGGDCVKLNNLTDNYYAKYYITSRRVF